MIALVAAASQNAIAANHRSIIDGLILIATIAFWNYALDWLGHRFPRFQRFYYPPPLPLVDRGRIQWRNLRRELITEDELMSQIGRAGLEDVVAIYMEGDGHVTVIPRDQPSPTPPQ